VKILFCPVTSCPFLYSCGVVSVFVHPQLVFSETGYVCGLVGSKFSVHVEAFCSMVR